MKILNKKQQKEIIQRASANHIIAKQLIDKCIDDENITAKAMIDWIGHLIDNTSRISFLVGGIEGMKMAEDITTKYNDMLNDRTQKNLEQYENTKAEEGNPC